MPVELDPITRTHLDRAADSLAEEFAGVFSRETVSRFVNESLDLLEHARFNEFLPVLAHRFARERLRALGQAGGEIAKDVPEVLFVCVQNAGRSQMAAALLKHRAAGRLFRGHDVGRERVVGANGEKARRFLARLNPR